MKSVVCSFSNFSLLQDDSDSNLYLIEYKISCKILLYSICHILNDNSNDKKSVLKNDFKCISFSAKKVQTLELHLMEREKNMGLPTLSYNPSLALLSTIDNQNDFLVKNGLSIFCIRLKDILVINDSIFIFINPENITPVDVMGKISFLSPFSRRGFCSPEILAIQSLPCKINKATYYYSLGALLTFCITNKNICEICELNSDLDSDLNFVVDENTGIYKHIIQYLKPISHTKLYWTILRLLPINPDKRRAIFV